jgi:hypothetical protein
VCDCSSRAGSPSATPGRFRTCEITDGSSPRFHVDHKDSRIKQPAAVENLARVSEMHPEDPLVDRRLTVNA